jgi:hypothetical protein
VSRSSVATFCVILATLPACAERSPGSGVTDTATPAVVLPTLPPPQELEPDLFDSEGCAILEDGERACPAKLTEPSGAFDPLEWRALQGFDGPYYSGSLDSGEATVLLESISTDVGGHWRAWGLVRNETSSPVGIDVNVSLFGPGGALLDIVYTHVLVDPLRPGEPGPFVIETDIAGESVGIVEWSARTTVPAAVGTRSFQILRFWTLPFDDWPPESPIPVPDSHPYPYVLFGGVDNLGAELANQQTHRRRVAGW